MRTPRRPERVWRLGSALARAGRRLVVLGGVGLAVASCGWQPVYAPTPKGDTAAAELAAIHIGPINERSGQVLYEALQERFGRAGIAAARRYELTVAFGLSAEILSIQQDLSATRIRWIGKASYTLTTDVPTHTTVTTGFARAVDGLNQFDQQYFASDQETDVVQRRIAQALADQIALQLAVFFHNRAAAADAAK